MYNRSMLCDLLNQDVISCKDGVVLALVVCTCCAYICDGVCVHVHWCR